MTEDARPTLSKRGEMELAARREREAAALRANLRRRKAQRQADDAPADQQRPPDREA